MASCHFTRPLHHLARYHNRQCTPLLTQIRGHRKRTPRPTTQEPTLNKTKPLSNIEADYHPTPETEQTNLVFAAVLDYETAQHLIHSDLTGRFPIQSSRGMNYVLVVYDYDSNAILAEPMRNRTDAKMLRAYGIILNRLIARGLKPKLQRLDNEASTALKNTCKMKWTSSTNLSHLTSIVAMLPNVPSAHSKITSFLVYHQPTHNFPLHLWCRLVRQAKKP
jgi:hypothetical protein